MGIFKGKWKFYLLSGAFNATFILSTISFSIANEPAMPPEGEIPIIEAQSSGTTTPGYSQSFDPPNTIPSHPPIDQIPPMPMPFPSGTSGIPADQEGVLIYDVNTKSVTQFSGTQGTGNESAGKVNGYDGINGSFGDEGWPASFGTMSKIINTMDTPWRMNVKLVMRSGQSYSSCSGTMRDAETVLTAAHCIYDDSADVFVDEVWVYPGWDGNGNQFSPGIINPYGYARSVTMSVPIPWVDSNYNYDVGLVAVDRAAGILTGWFGAAAGDCASWALPKTWNNASYPGENCGTGLHTGTDMYYWFGDFDVCHDTQQLQINTTPGCLSALWGGQSGSGVYYIDGDNRYVHGIASRSNRTTLGIYSTQYQGWIDYGNNTFIPQYARGSDFDLQPLNTTTDSNTLVAGLPVHVSHLAVNPTNGGKNDRFYFNTYLSANSNISSADTLLESGFYDYNFPVMGSALVGFAGVNIPADVPPGDYYIGVEYDAATDGDVNNNDSDDWDAASVNITRIHYFDDVPPAYWAFTEVEQLIALGITSGCNLTPALYCPESPVTRAQMAIFILKGIEGSAYMPPDLPSVFNDVPADYWAQDWITEFSSRGITSGCGGGNYCPDTPVTREQMAIFLLRGIHGPGYVPPPATGIFNDVPLSHPYVRWIEQLAVEGITGGCGDGNFCPSDTVSRAQMAVFLIRAFAASGSSNEGYVVPEGEYKATTPVVTAPSDL